MNMKIDKLTRQAVLILALGSVMFLFSCGEDEVTVDPPVAGFTAAVNGTSVTFTNTSTGEGNTYMWDFDDGTTSEEANPTKVYSAAGTYNVSLVATNEGGTNEFSDDVVVNSQDSEAPVITLTGAADIDIEVGGTFTDEGATAADNVDGDLTSSIVVGGDVVDTNTSGTYVITYDVSDAAGNAATQVTRTVRVRFPGMLISNGDFQGSTTEPWIVNFGDGTVPVETTGTNSYFIVNIQTAADAYVVNLSQVVTLEKDKTYKLSFNASSDVSRSFIAGIGLNGDPWSATTETVNVTSTEERIELELKAGFVTDGVDSRVLFDLAGEVGVVVLDNIKLEEIQSTTAVPTDAPTAPTTAAADVISLFSDEYTDITVDTWSADWDDASVEDLEIAGNNVKKISFGDNGGFLGVDFSSNSFDASAYTHFHMDYWIADDFAAGQVLNPKWSNHAGGAEVNAFEYTNAIGDTQSGTWVSLDVAIADFAAGSGTTRDNLAQFILAGANTIDVVYIDNIYLYK
jgi:PKD repeat protein